MLTRITEDFAEFLSLLKKHHVDYAICGGHAVAFYGFPRMTLDFDILVNPTENNAKNLMCALNEFGFGDIPDLNEALFCQKGVVFSLGVQPNQIDLLTSMSSQPETEIFEHKVVGELEGIEVFFVSYDDLLRAKKEAGRLKDLLDIEELEKLHK